jgi:hypothetical protein
MKNTKIGRPSSRLMEGLKEASFLADANVCPYFSIDELSNTKKGNKTRILLYKLQEMGILKSMLMNAGINRDGTSDYVRVFRFNGRDKYPRGNWSNNENDESCYDDD